ncbi:hypothetical protein Tco_0162480 [Tanacetum coccineum]
MVVFVMWLDSHGVVVACGDEEMSGDKEEMVGVGGGVGEGDGRFRVGDDGVGWREDVVEALIVCLWEWPGVQEEVWIVCHEKVVRIRWEGVRDTSVLCMERTLGAVKALMNAKVDEPRISDIPVVRDFIDVFLEELSMTPRQQVEFLIGLVHGATLVAKSPYRLTPSEMQEFSGKLQELQDKGFI